MQQIEIDHIGLQPLQTAFAGVNNPAIGSIVRIDLRDQKDLVAPACHRLGNDLLGTAFAIHLRRIDQVQSKVETGLQRIDFTQSPSVPLAHAPGTKPQRRHLFSGS